LPSQAKSKVGYDDVVSLHFNAQADFGSRACQLGLLGLRRSLLLRRCWRGRLPSRLLTTSTHADDDGCNNNHLIRDMCLPHIVAVQPRRAVGKEKGARAARQEAGALAAAPPKF
jgi:hypothetical protein